MTNTMTPRHFPVYRKLANGRSCYRIESETAFTEIQRVGSRYVAHHVVAHTWPERLRIQDMLANADDSLAPITRAEFEDWLHRSEGT